MPDTVTDAIRDTIREYRPARRRRAESRRSRAISTKPGLTSHASVNLMLALEERFDIEFPERMLRRGAFASIAAIRAGLEELIGAGA